jgi:hypothetical protein
MQLDINKKTIEALRAIREMWMALSLREKHSTNEFS